MLRIVGRWESGILCRWCSSQGVRWKRGADSFLNPNNSQYIEGMYNSWLKDPESVGESWDRYFKATGSPPEVKSSSAVRLSTKPSNMPSAQMSEISPPGGSTETTLDIDATIRAYQARGHLIADTDPLGLQNPDSAKLQGTFNLPPAVVVRQHLKGMTDVDLDREFPLGSLTVIGGDKKRLPLRDILMRLNKVYCGHLGLEYTFIPDFGQLDWLRHKFEIPGAWELPPDHRKTIWMNVMRAVTFEGFLAKKYLTEKRFGLEGCEAFIPALIECFETSAETGIESAVIGMAHRGRLNTLVNVCGKPLDQLFTQFNPVPLEGLGSGDVKYHLGTHSEKILDRTGKTLRIAMLANPSHLEAVDPLVVGRVRAEQVALNDLKSEKSLAVLVHGDAAFAGQGICYEVMHLTNLPDYTTGGVIHAVINNQIGFTTDPRYSRSSSHCTDVGRVVNAPIFHVHADDPDLVAYCSRVAAEYRSVYHNDVVVDIVGYRRNGHNEMDEPMLTQPLMYKRIKNHPNVLTIYTDKLVKEGIIDESFVKQIIMTPKSLLRHPMAQSSFDEFETGTAFRPMYPDKTTSPEKIKKVLICSGKVYYDLVAARIEQKLEDQIAIIRIEQICPFPYDLVAREVSRFPNTKIMWLQEEHKNQGAYHYVRDRLATALKVPLEEISYGGRPPSSAPATGSKIIFKEQYNDMLNAAMSIIR
ncbi:2-oxoglutarate dehydrogenase, mitochondrial isoform X2 [Fopius arisanus]|uniref:2-oxoglutarate dehydrogenase, mitochondrial n=1 Tax=Fopius arisanus TaxID=64838 RepID=A0A9R1SVQ0_9HYME|nr:PREDICTED: 2-oxoglutarate dehydrogenase, mitochondrial isoform X2 [Fopius arisanus]